MTEEQFRNLEWKKARVELPVASRGVITVFVITTNGKRAKAMFYYNGGKPTFASYGSVIENVIMWAYINK
jgi:hypothetical protein